MTDDEALFPGYDPPPGEPVGDLSAGRRLTLRQAAQVAAGVHPLTRGPLHRLASRARDATSPRSDPFTCGSCWFRETWQPGANRYPKCLAYDGVRVTRGPASDVRAWWPACPDYSPGARGVSPDAVRTVPVE